MKKKYSYKVLITTSGLGSRLGNLTAYTNKSLVSLGDKPAISYIVENYPTEIPIVVTLGHHGNLVKEFLEIAYPERIFEFIHVDKYQGVGSSLAYSMLEASKSLQEPFIFHAGDTLVFNTSIPEPTNNWVFGAKAQEKSASQYASFDVTSEKVMKFHPKGMLDFDYLHVGLVGIHEYQLFWEELKRVYLLDPMNQAVGDLDALTLLVNSGVEFSCIEALNWQDVGSIDGLRKARMIFKSEIDVLEKSDEAIHFVNGSVIKFFSNPQIVSGRVERANSLKELTPSITAHSNHFYKYPFQDGTVMSKSRTERDFSELLQWSSSRLWIKNNELGDNDYSKLCHKFYFDKTILRVEEFFKKTGFLEGEQTINGFRIPTVDALLERIDQDFLSSGLQTAFHGDFILDNILKTNSGFKLLDWRQDFGGDTSSGDMYYDLAKLKHSLTINHEIVTQGLFEISISNQEIYCGIHRRDLLVEFEKLLNKFILEQALDGKRVALLTPLIWLNMAALHHHPFDLFLFNFGKLHLWKALEDA